MTAMARRAGEVVIGAADAAAHRIEIKPKDGFKIFGYTFSWLSYINDAALARLGGLGEYLKAAKGATALWYPLDCVVEFNKLGHSLYDYVTNQRYNKYDAAGNISEKPVVSGRKLSKSFLSALIPSCDSLRTFHNYSIINLSHTAPLFASFSFLQVFSVLGGLALTARFGMESADIYKKINVKVQEAPGKIRQRQQQLEQVNRQLGARNPQNIEQLKDRKKYLESKIKTKKDYLTLINKNKADLTSRVCLAALGVLLASFAALGTFYVLPVLLITTIELTSHFVAQYFKEHPSTLPDGIA